MVWHIDRGGDNIRSETGQLVAQFWTRPTPDHAALMAAAPELAAALKALLPQVDSEIEHRKFGGSDEDWRDLQELSDAGHAALVTCTLQRQ